MIDINLIRNAPDLVKASQRKRGEDESIVDEISAVDREWRQTTSRLNELRHLRNLKNNEVRETKSRGGDIKPIIEEVRKINAEIKELEGLAVRLKTRRNEMLMALPNIVHESVPIGKDEKDNVPIRFWGKARVFKDHEDNFKEQSMGKMEYEVIDKKPISHVDILEGSGKADFLRAGKIAGSRFYYLKEEFVLLDLALQRYALDFLRSKGYTVINPPYMMNRRAYMGVTDLMAFEDTLYKIEGEELYLIATSEHPMAAMFMDEILEVGQLPMKFAGISPCFRKEAGAHGKDTKGIFRVHQFNKIEQFIYCLPEDSWHFHEELIRNAEEMFQGLELPYRIVNICTGDLGAVASKKYDLEVWMPVQGTFREMVSASNVLDYQARRLNIRIRGKEENFPPHMLNSTGIATSRAIVAIIENFQDDDGSVIRIPKVLHKYTGFEVIELGKR